MKLLFSHMILLTTLQALPWPQGAPINEMEIDRAINAGRPPPAPIYDMPDIPGSEPSPDPPPEKPEEPSGDSHSEQAPSPTPSSLFKDPSNATPEEMGRLFAALQPDASSVSSTSPSTSAVPQSSSPPVLQTENDVEKGYGQNQARKDNTCVIFDPPDRIATSKMCENVCGLVVKKQLEADRSGSTACIGSSPPGKDPWVVEEGMILTQERLSKTDD